MWWLLALVIAAWMPQNPPASGSLDFETFKSRVEPIFLAKHKGYARCYVCHSQGTTFRLQRLAPGATSWTEDESRKNLEAVRRLVAPGNPAGSRLLLMPLSADAGGVAFHPGGKRWVTRDDPEWRTIAGWIAGR
jgi:hypothetical protein